MKISPILFCHVLIAGTLLTACKSSQTALRSGKPSAEPRLVVNESFVIPNKHFVHIDSAWMIGNLLKLRINYSGGCNNHYFVLKTNGKLSKNVPPEMKFFLDDTTRNDNCRRFIEEETQFDLRSLQRSETAAILLNLNESHKLVYAY